MPIFEFHDFPKKIVCLRGPKNFVGEPFCVSQNFWYRKILWIGGWGGRRREGVSSFSVKVFLCHSAEYFHGATFPFCTIFLVSKNFIDKRWG